MKRDSYKKKLLKLFAENMEFQSAKSTICCHTSQGVSLSALYRSILDSTLKKNHGVISCATNNKPILGPLVYFANSRHILKDHGSTVAPNFGTRFHNLIVSTLSVPSFSEMLKKIFKCAHNSTYQIKITLLFTFPLT